MLATAVSESAANGAHKQNNGIIAIGVQSWVNWKVEYVNAWVPSLGYRPEIGLEYRRPSIPKAYVKFLLVIAYSSGMNRGPHACSVLQPIRIQHRPPQPQTHRRGKKAHRTYLHMQFVALMVPPHYY